MESIGSVATPEAGKSCTAYYKVSLHSWLLVLPRDLFLEQVADGSGEHIIKVTLRKTLERNWVSVLVRSLPKWR